MTQPGRRAPWRPRLIAPPAPSRPGNRAYQPLARGQAPLAVAHLHSRYATAFAVARCEFRPALLSGDLFCDGVPIYAERRLITTPE
ncbi:MAG: hypothetical protein ACRDU4_10620 [Mycobacterium sp.]